MSHRGIIRQLFSFGGVGIAATLVHVAVAMILSYSIGWGAVASNAAAATLAFFVSYFGNEKLTFSNERGRAASLWRYATLTLLSFVVASGIMMWVDASGLQPYVYALIVPLIVPPMTFLLARMWVFRKPRGE